MRGKLLLLPALLLLSAGCARPFDVRTAPGFVELDAQDPPYAYRALAPEGVVVAVRVIDVGDRGDLEFWTRAVTLRMRQLDGYALLGTAPVKSLDGTAGRELRFGRDENRKPYAYTVRLYVAQDRLFLLESGGPKEVVDRYGPSIDWMQRSLRVRCDSPLAPVLASRTCHRW
ncbi:MAG: serine/threonine protein kinase [Myxococcales bacterium]|nr:serine/threonine protein kinase [Myxococcales bacterium]